MAKDLIFKTDGTFDFGDSKSLSTRFNLAELKMGGRVGFKDRGSLNVSPQYKKLIELQNKHRFAPEKTRISFAGEGRFGDQVYPQQDLAEDFEILRNQIDNPPKGGGGIPKQDLIKSEAAIKIDQANPNATRNELRKLYKEAGLTIQGKTLKRKRPFRMTDELIEKVKVILDDPINYPTKEKMMKALGYATDPRPGKTFGMGSFDRLLEDYEKATGAKINRVERFPTSFRYKGSEVSKQIGDAAEAMLVKGDNVNVKQLARLHLKDRFLKDPAGARQEIRRILKTEGIDIDTKGRTNIKGDKEYISQKRRNNKIKYAAKMAGKEYEVIANSLIEDVRDLNNYYKDLAKTNPDAILKNKKLVDALTVQFDIDTGKVVRPKVSNEEILRRVNKGIFDLEHIRPVGEMEFGTSKAGKPYVTKGVNIGYPNNLQIATKNMNQQFLNNTRLYMARNNLDKIPVNAETILKNQNLRTNINGVMHGAQSNNVGWDSKTKTSPIFKNNLDALDVDFTKDTLFKKAGNVVKPILKYAGRTAIKLAAPFVPFLAPAAATLGALDVKEAHARGLTKPEELGTAYYLGPTAAEGMRDITDYDYKGRAAKEFENMKESWANLGTGSGEVVDDVSEQMIGFKTGGSVEPRIPYRDGTSVAPNPPQEKSWEDTTAEWDKTLSAGGFNNDKPMYQKFGDMVDAESLFLYYPALLNEAGLNVADFATRLPKVAKYLFEDVLTTPVGTGIDSLDVDNSGIHKAWTEITRPYEWSKKVPYGYGEDGIVTLDDLITNREAKMKAAGKSDWPVIAGKNIQLGAELVAPVFPGLKILTSGAKNLKNSGTQLLDRIMSQKGMNTNVIDEALTAKGMSRRDFNKIVAVGGLAAALKAAGLSDMFKVAPIKPTTAGIKILRESSTKMPAWFPQFVDKISAKMIYEGDGISKYVGTADELPGVEVTKNGENWTVAGKNEYGQDFELHYEAPGYIDAGAEGGSPVFYKGDFTANDTVPSAYVGPEDVDYDASLLTEVDEVLGGTRQLEEFATGKEVKTPTVGENRVTQAEMKADHDYDMWQEQQADDFIDE
jgi:hypothetical protein